MTGDESLSNRPFSLSLPLKGGREEQAAVSFRARGDLGFGFKDERASDGRGDHLCVVDGRIGPGLELALEGRVAPRSCIRAWKRASRRELPERRCTSTGLPVPAASMTMLTKSSVATMASARARNRLKDRPTASAAAMPWASMPTEPSVTIQVFSPLAFRLAATSASVPLGPAWEAGSEGMAPAPLKLPKRKTLNFFSILLAGGRKIARSEPRQGVSDAAF